MIDPQDAKAPPTDEQTNPSRRDALRRAALSAAALALAPIAGACASNRARIESRVGQPFDSTPGVAPINPGAPIERPQARVTTIARSAWASFGLNPARASYMNGIDAITIHHDGMNAFASASQSDAASRLESIRRAHVGRGWADIGYHYAIDPAGRVWEARPLDYQGAHVKNHNPHNIGILVMGNYELQSPTSASLESLDRFLGQLKEEHRITAQRVFTHRELRATACPGASLQREMDRLRGPRGLFA